MMNNVECSKSNNQIGKKITLINKTLLIKKGLKFNSF